MGKYCRNDITYWSSLNTIHIYPLFLGMLLDITKHIQILGQNTKHHHYSIPIVFFWNIDEAPVVTAQVGSLDAPAAGRSQGLSGFPEFFRGLGCGNSRGDQRFQSMVRVLASGYVKIAIENGDL